MANPYASPHRRQAFIPDQRLWWRWSAINRHLLGSYHLLQVQNGILLIDDEFYIAKHNPLMRLKSHLDWVHYTPGDLAQAIISDSVPVYYEYQMQDPASPHNQWQDPVEEMDLKAYYATRDGRANRLA